LYGSFGEKKSKVRFRIDAGALFKKRYVFNNVNNNNNNLLQTRGPYHRRNHSTQEHKTFSTYHIALGAESVSTAPKRCY